jgi:hypothetical protein
VDLSTWSNRTRMEKCSRTFKLASVVGFLLTNATTGLSQMVLLVSVRLPIGSRKQCVLARESFASSPRQARWARWKRSILTHVFLSPPMPRQPPILHGAPL